MRVEERRSARSVPVCMSLRVAASARARLRGLLGRAPSERAIVLVPCADVHTFGMRANLDVAFVNCNALVVEAYRDVPPGRRIRAPGACVTVERFSQPGEPWFESGDAVALWALRGVSENANRGKEA